MKIKLELEEVATLKYLIEDEIKRINAIIKFENKVNTYRLVFKYEKLLKLLKKLEDYDV